MQCGIKMQTITAQLDTFSYCMALVLHTRWHMQETRVGDSTARPHELCKPESGCAGRHEHQLANGKKREW